MATVIVSFDANHRCLPQKWHRLPRSHHRRLIVLRVINSRVIHFIELAQGQSGEKTASSDVSAAGPITQTHGEHGTPNAQEHMVHSVSGIGAGGEYGFGVEEAEIISEAPPVTHLL